MKKTYLIIFLINFFLFLTGCKTEDVAENSYTLNDFVRFGAYIDDLGSSRAIPENGRIMDGKLNLTFIDKNKLQEIGEVSFSGGFGTGQRYINGNWVELVWGEVGFIDDKNSTYSFYLDNLYLDNLPDSLKSNKTLVTLPEGHPYTASLYSHEDNDLIWGALENVSRANTLYVDLNHMMSRLRLRVYIDNSMGSEELWPISATISNIARTAITFDRLTGNLGLKKDTNGENYLDPEPFILVKDKDKDEDEEGWVRVDEVNDDNNIAYYLSPDYVVPPQTFVYNNRPRISVKLSNGTVCSGVLPLAMDLIGENGELIPWTMSFLKGYRLTLTVKISNNSNTLVFMPATVLDWYDKGKKTLTGYQASVNKSEDFNELVSAYNNSQSEKFYQWGYLADEGTNKWVFNVFQNLNFVEADLNNKMHEKSEIPYEFSLHYAIVTVTMNDGRNVNLSRTNEGAERLKALLNGNILWGELEDSNDFSKLISAYNNGSDVNQLWKYGSYDSESHKWTFHIYQNMEISIESIQGNMVESADRPYEIDLHTAKITILYPEDEKLELTKAKGGADLKKILTGEEESGSNGGPLPIFGMKN